MTRRYGIYGRGRLLRHFTMPSRYRYVIPLY